MVVKRLSAHAVAFLLLVSVFLSVQLTLIFVSADSSLEIYLNWEVNDPRAIGHLTIIGLPRVMEYGHTYKTDFKISVEMMEWGDSVEFQMISWIIETGENRAPLLIGFSGVYATQYSENESITKSVHLSLPEPVQEKRGLLNLDANLIIHDSTTSESIVPTGLSITPSVTIDLRNESNLTLFPPHLEVELGEQITVSGSLVPVVSGTYINLYYYRPNSTRIERVTITDENGSFSDKIVPDVEGIWRVIANWTENEYISTVTSNAVSFRVEARSPLILIIASLAVLFVFVLYSVKLRKSNKDLSLE